MSRVTAKKSVKSCRDILQRHVQLVFDKHSLPNQNQLIVLTLNDLVNTPKIVWVDSISLNVLFFVCFYLILWKVNEEILNLTSNIYNVSGFYYIIREIFNEYSYMNGQLFWSTVLKHFKLQVSPSKDLTYLYEFMILLTNIKMIDFSEHHF